MRSLITAISIVAFIFLVLYMIGCETPRSEFEREKSELNAVEGVGRDVFYIITIDGCEYVVYNGSQKGAITHKANCKNHGN